MKRVYALVAIGISALIIGKILVITSHNEDTHFSIKGIRLQVEIANTAEQRERGLCCRDSLPSDQGMLFTYDQPGDYHFWMKDTRIPLDMYWLSSGKKIIHIEENVQPESYPKKFGAGQPAQYVLETNAGFAKKHNIKIGDPVSF